MPRSELDVLTDLFPSLRTLNSRQIEAKLQGQILQDEMNSIYRDIEAMKEMAIDGLCADTQTRVRKKGKTQREPPVAPTCARRTLTDTFLAQSGIMFDEATRIANACSKYVREEHRALRELLAALSALQKSQ